MAITAGFGIAVYGAFQYLASQRTYEQSVEDARDASVLLTSYIKGQRDSLESVVHYVARSREAREVLDSPSATRLQALRTLRSQLRVDGLLLTNERGQTIVADGLNEPSLVHRLVLRALSEEHEQTVVAIGRTLALATVEPVVKAGVHRGTLTAFKRFDPAVQDEIPIDRRFDVVFVSGNRVLGDHDTLQTLSLPDEGTLWKLKVDGRAFEARHAALTGTLPEQRVSYVVLRPEGERSPRETTFMLLFGTVIAVISLVALLAGSTMTNSLLRSLDGLVQAAKQLQIGEWPPPLPANRPDEIGLLEETFNAMSESIQISQERLLSMVDIDPLTELMNHRRFKEALSNEVVRATATGQSLGLLILDIDNFKRLNEDLGNEGGDAALCVVATAIRAEAPRFSIVARYGADQFAVLLPGGDNPTLRVLFASITDLTPSLRLSAGCAEFAETGGTAESFILAAELALARAKDNGRDQICDFTTFQTGEFRDPSAFNRIIDDGTYATIRALAAAVDAKDPYTHGHSERVAHYASAFAEYMGLSPAEIDRIHRCGTLHDVGKIGIPDAILQKQGRLTEDELRVMQTHSALGENIVRRVPQLQDLLPGVRHHHERYDGNGYPDGLRGDQIPMEARYLAIADTFDAMTSDRPYRKGLAMPVAMEEIRRGAGSQFDPALAVAFAEMLRGQIQEAA